MQNKITNNGFTNKLNKELKPPELRIIQFSYLTMSLPWDNPNRTAPFWRFYWSATPGAYIVFQEKKIELKPGNIVLIAPNIRYASYSDNPFTQLYIHFEWDMNLLPVEPLLFPSLPMKNLLCSAEEWFGCPGEMFSLRLHALLFYYLSELADLRMDTHRIDPRIRTAMNLIDQDLTLNNIGLAQRLNMSCDNFQRLFRKNIGFSPCQYRNSRRMEHAQQLLQNPELNIDEIALQCGFMNRYHFSKAYKSFFKTTPAADRRKSAKTEIR